MGGKVFGVAVIPCALVFWGPVALYCHVLRALAYVCNTCSVVLGAREQGLAQARRPRVSALVPPEPEHGPC